MWLLSLISLLSLFVAALNIWATWGSSDKLATVIQGISWVVFLFSFFILALLHLYAVRYFRVPHGLEFFSADTNKE